MSRYRFAAGLIAILWLALGASSASAFFHQWKFTELFSNADGTVQFIEMGTTAPSENVPGANSMWLRSTATGKVFTFNHNLVPATTTNKRILIATAGFQSQPGLPVAPATLLTPDYTIDANFFSTAGDTIRFCQGTAATCTTQYDIRTFTAGFPIDGVTSLNFAGATVTMVDNSPRNYAGTTGKVDLTPPPDDPPNGDYNGDLIVDAADYTLWRNTYGTMVENEGDGADGDESGEIDDGDYSFWVLRYGDVIEPPPPGAGGGTTVPEPSTIVMAIGGLLMSLLRRRR